MASQLLEIFTQDIWQSWEELHKHALSGAPTGRNPCELDPETKQAMPLALDAQCTFLDVQCSYNRHLFHSVLERWCTETTNLASQPEKRLQAVLLKQFPVNNDITEQLSLSGVKQEYMTMSLTIPAHMPTVKCLQIAQGLSCVPKRLLWTLNTHSYVTTYVHRILWKKKRFICSMFMLQPLEKLHR